MERVRAAADWEAQWGREEYNDWIANDWGENYRSGWEEKSPWRTTQNWEKNEWRPKEQPILKI